MSKHTKKRTKIKLKDPKRILIFFAIIIIILIIIKSGKQSIKTKNDLSVIINNTDVTSQIQDEIIIKDEILYLSMEDIRKCLDPNIFQEGDKIITYSDKKVAALELGKRKIEINGSTVNIRGQAYKTDTGKRYLPVSEMKNAYDIEYQYVPEYKNIVIDNYSKKLEKAYTNKNIYIKEEMKKSSSNIEQIKKGEWLVYVSEQNGWAKVRTQKGNLGYTQKKYLTNFITQREEWEEKKDNIEITYKIDISSKDIKKYDLRKNVIEEILAEAVNKKEKGIKITYKNADSEEFKRFKLEATRILKECGITVEF